MDEWRKGWADGLLTQVLITEKERHAERREEGARLTQKREANLMALTMHAAAAGFDADAILGLRKKTSSNKSFGKKKASKH